MIRYTLKCDQGHTFESWFASASAYDTVRKAGHVACVHCGSHAIEKALMAPAVSQVKAPPPDAPPTVTPKNDALAALRREVEEKSDYVGDKFVTEARAMHNGSTPERAIYGEARIDEAKALIDDGIPVLPLPFVPKIKTN